MAIQELPLLEKITQLKAKLFGADQDHMDTVLEWERQAKEALINDDLAGHEGIQRIIAKITEDIADIDSILHTGYSKDVSDGDRDRMLDMKNFYQWFLTFFTSAQSKIMELGETLDLQLNNEESQDL
ncbi:MAG: hypothetical protein V4478_03295 [Patescibacteria group bacterium]